MHVHTHRHIHTHTQAHTYTFHIPSFCQDLCPHPPAVITPDAWLQYINYPSFQKRRVFHTLLRQFLKIVLASRELVDPEAHPPALLLAHASLETVMYSLRLTF